MNASRRLGARSAAKVMGNNCAPVASGIRSINAGARSAAVTLPKVPFLYATYCRVVLSVTVCLLFAESDEMFWLM